MSLVTKIEDKRKEIKTDGYPMSVSEWISMYERKELDIHPEFQRFYRWADNQKTSLIESILLGIPIPPIFVSQRKDGIWDVVDGLQRLSTIFQFVGVLKDENGKSVPPLTLNGTKYLPSLDGIRWENKEKPEKALPPEIQLLIKRSKISASIILPESDETAKYDLFQRLNTGGAELSPQEVRNCLLVMLNRKMFEWLKSLTEYKSFQGTISLSDRPLEQAYDLELALRFVIFFNMDLDKIKKVGDVGEFITNQMRELAAEKKFPYKEYEKTFKDTFDILSSTVSEEAFKRYNKSKTRHEGGFLVSQYEVVALGIGFNINQKSLIAEKKIPTVIKNIWSTKEYTDWSASGLTATRRLPHLIPLGRNIFNNQ